MYSKLIVESHIMKKICLLVFLILACRGVYPCTTAIISGKATPDGRPLLWKHRDAREEENDLRFFKGEQYDFIGLCNTNDTSGTQVWMGSNNAGFSIINSNAYNLERGSKYRGPMDLEGYIMKDALSRCGTLENFEQMLDSSKGKRGTQSNFGVIDAQGGAAYYETTPDSYTKFDINDSTVAPAGYLIRTNYGFSGGTEHASGYIRYDTAFEMFLVNRTEKKLSVEFLLLEATRSLKHALLGIDLYAMDLPLDKTSRHIVPFRDYIVQGSSVSSMVIQGVKKGENPNLTTLWTIPAFQLCSLTVPVWVAAGMTLPEVVTSADSRPAPLSSYALELKKRCFPIQGREGHGYLDIAPLLNKKGTGILQKILTKDREIIDKTQSLLKSWRENGFNPEAARGHYHWIDTFIHDSYRNEIGQK